MKKKLLMALLAGTLAVAAPVSCFAAEETTENSDTAAGDEAEESDEAESEDEDASAKKKDELKTVGEEKEGCITFKLKNSTSRKITGLAIKTADETEFPENMMEADDSFELKEKKRIYFSKETEENAEENRKVAVVKSAISTLSFSEMEAITHIFDELNGTEGILVASKIADRVGITRSVIVNALRKFESAGVIESRSSGMKGTYIKVLNDVVFEEVEALKRQLNK